MIPYCALNAHKLLYFSSHNEQSLGYTRGPKIFYHESVFCRLKKRDGKQHVFNSLLIGGELAKMATMLKVGPGAQFGHLDKTVRAFFLWIHFETTSFWFIYYCAFRYILGHTASIIPKKKEVSKICDSRSPFIYPVKCIGRGHKVILRYVQCNVLLIVIKR